MAIERFSFPEGIPLRSPNNPVEIKNLYVKEAKRGRILRPGEYDITPPVTNPGYTVDLNVYPDGRGRLVLLRHPHNEGETTLFTNTGMIRTKDTPGKVIEMPEYTDTFFIAGPVKRIPYLYEILLYSPNRT